jgi:hypothetical protein
MFEISLEGERLVTCEGRENLVNKIKRKHYPRGDNDNTITGDSPHVMYSSTEGAGILSLHRELRVRVA